MHPELKSYYSHEIKTKVQKSIETLAGIIDGIAFDNIIKPQEVHFLKGWIGEHTDVRNRHPFSELIPLVEASIDDDVLSQEEREDIIWLCKKLSSEGKYFDDVTADLQHLHGALAGVLSDGVINEKELQKLEEWILLHDHLKTCWPYDEIESLILSVMKDGIIDDEEHKGLITFFADFIATDHLVDGAIPEGINKKTISGICAIDPEIVFSDQLFCFTGISERYSRNEMIQLVQERGGETSAGAPTSTDYLIVGAKGNPCWVYACYGRKIEKCIEYRKRGQRIVFVHENDFHDAVLGTEPC